MAVVEGVVSAGGWEGAGDQGEVETTGNKQRFPFNEQDGGCRVVWCC